MTDDRTSCAANRHGDESAYRYGCRCTDAREDHRLKRKRRREGRAVPASVDVTGTTRRLRALAAIGWSLNDVATELDMSRRHVNELRSNAGGGYTMRSTAEKVGDLYERLSAAAGPNPTVRTWAGKHGWAPPLLWEDVDIDDPAAQPAVDNPVIDRRRRIDLAEVEFFAAGGMSLDDVAVRLRVPVGSIRVSQARARQRVAA